MTRPKFKPGNDYYLWCEKVLHYYVDSCIAQINDLLERYPRKRCSWRLIRKITKRLENSDYPLKDWYGYEKIPYLRKKEKICAWKDKEKRKAEARLSRLGLLSYF